MTIDNVFFPCLGRADGTEEDPVERGKLNGKVNGNKHRLERFGKAMIGTGSWEAPGAVLTGAFIFINVICLMLELFLPVCSS